MSKENIIIGSRGSDLALWQANHIKEKLKEIGIGAEIKIIKTQGDAVQHLSFEKLEGKGFFTKELEEALLKNEIDLAVHSHKDLPTDFPKGLVIAAVSDREDPSETLLINKNSVDETEVYSIKKGAVVGTSSARRKTQLMAHRADFDIKELRGNVPTRIQKLRENKYDAIMLASAGIERLEIDVSEFFVKKLPPHEFVPAPAQGVLALQIRENDIELNEKLQALNNKKISALIGVERKVLNLFDGGCQLPLGVYCEQDTDEDEKTFYKVWVSKAATAEQLPVYRYFTSEKIDGFADKIVRHLTACKPTSVFITKNLKTESLFKNVLLSNKFNVSGNSLIEFKKVSFKEIPVTNWVFFASKHAVEFFFQQKPVLSTQKIGVIGKATADAVRKFGKRAEFIGYSTDTKLTGKQFAAKVGSETVLFPQAKGSLRSVQKQFTNTTKTVDLTVYETIQYTDVVIPIAEIVVFTSPSNVQAFFGRASISSSQKIVAMGGATEYELQKFGIKRCILPHSFDDIGLLQAVFEASEK